MIDRRRDDAPGTPTTFDIFTRPWSLAILAECHAGACRFNELRQRLGISPKMLTMRLERLVDEEILQRSQYQSNPTRFEYRLTAKGRDLSAVLVTIDRWAKRWNADGPNLEADMTPASTESSEQIPRRT